MSILGGGATLVAAGVRHARSHGETRHERMEPGSVAAGLDSAVPRDAGQPNPAESFDPALGRPGAPGLDALDW